MGERYYSCTDKEMYTCLRLKYDACKACPGIFPSLPRSLPSQPADTKSQNTADHSSGMDAKKIARELTTLYSTLTTCLHAALTAFLTMPDLYANFARDT